MAGPISLLAVSNLLAPPSSSRAPSRRSSRHTHSDDVNDENCAGGEHDAEEEEEMDAMYDEDERYWAGLRRSADYGVRRRSSERANTHRPSADRGRSRRSAEQAYSHRGSRSSYRESQDIEPAPLTPGEDIRLDRLGSDASGKDGLGGSSEGEKALVSPTVPHLHSGEPGRRPRRLSGTRDRTARSFKSFKTMVSTAWEKRHDEKHVGFWRAVWSWIVGNKDNPNEGLIDEDHPDYIPPKYRWTPILSGLIQPFAILLEIPGLTEHWYVRLDRSTNEPVVYQENPVILDVGLAISMTCAIVANLALISRFMERRILASTITCIIALSIHDIINIITVSIFGVIHGVDDGFDYSQAFWTCICSTAASFFTNCFLVFDLFKTKDFRRSGSGLTLKQRNLVIIVMILLLYICIGALVFNFLIPDMHFQSALYYTIVTIETIGFGDFSPSTIGAKIFLFFYVPLGILNLAVTVGTARDTIVESWSAAYRRRRHEALRRHRERKEQREVEAVRRAALERQIRAMGQPLYVDMTGGGSRGMGPGMSKFTLNLGVLSPVQIEKATQEAEEELAKKNGESGATAAPSVLSGKGDKQDLLAEAKRMQEELVKQSLHNEENYREIQENMVREEKMENLVKFGFAFSLFVVFWVVGATVFARTEDWTWFEGFYFCFVTFTTIGYGDFSPTSPAGRAFFLIWAILGVATVTLLIAVLVEAYSSRYKSALSRRGKRGDLQHRLAAWAHHGAHWRRHDADNHSHTEEKGEGEGDSVVQGELKVEAERMRLEKEKRERTPMVILETLSKFHTQVKAFRQAEAENNRAADAVPDALKQLLSDYMNDHGMSELEKREVLGDADMRRAVFWKAYENSLQKLVVLASDQVQAQQKTFTNLQALDTLAASFSPLYVGGKGLTRVVTRTPSVRGPATPSFRTGSIFSPLSAVCSQPIIQKNGLRIRTEALAEMSDEEVVEEESGWTSQPDLLLPGDRVARRRLSG